MINSITNNIPSSKNPEDTFSETSSFIDSNDKFFNYYNGYSTNFDFNIKNQVAFLEYDNNSHSSKIYTNQLPNSEKLIEIFFQSKKFEFCSTNSREEEKSFLFLEKKNKIYKNKKPFNIDKYLNKNNRDIGLTENCIIKQDYPFLSIDEKFHNCLKKEIETKNSYNSTENTEAKEKLSEITNIFDTENININQLKKFFCNHSDCNLAFKTLKLRNMHHNNIEKECKILKINLIKIVNKYKNLFIELGQKFSFDKYDKTKLLNLKRNYEIALEDSTDKNYITSIVGKNFDSYNR